MSKRFDDSNGPLGRRRRLASFTLVEVILVVLLVAILAAIAVPLVIDSTSGQTVAAARRIASDLQYAQNLAIATQTPVTVTFSVDEETYGLANASGALIHPMTNNAYEVCFASEPGLESLNIVSVQFSGTSEVTFDELGAPSSAGSIVLQAGPHTIRLDVANASGLVSVTVVGP